jgi:hypothetical protein
MPYPNRLPSRSDRNDLVIVHHHGGKTIAAVATGASLVACADGRATSDERRALLRFLRERGVLARSGRKRTVDAFDRAVEAAAGCDLTEALSAMAALADKPSAMLAFKAAQRSGYGGRRSLATRGCDDRCAQRPASPSRQRSSAASIG